MAEKPSKNLESLYTSIYTLSCLKKGRSKFNLQWNYGPISTEGQKKIEKLASERKYKRHRGIFKINDRKKIFLGSWPSVLNFIERAVYNIILEISPPNQLLQNFFKKFFSW